MKKIIYMAMFGLMLIAATACGNSRDYYAACERYDFKKAHSILHDMHEDIIKDIAEYHGTNFGLWAGWYKEYINAAITVYGEEFKFLFDQESDENNPRIKVLLDECGTWASQTLEELNGLRSQHGSNYTYEGEFNKVIEYDLTPKMNQLNMTIMSLAKAYNNKEILDMFGEGDN